MNTLASLGAPRYMCIRTGICRYGTIDFRFSTFLFTSNSGAVNISAVFKSLREGGRARADVEYRDFTEVLEDDLGLSEPVLVSKNRVDFYIPFLPMEAAVSLSCPSCTRAHRPLPHLSASRSTSLEPSSSIRIFPSVIAITPVSTPRQYYGGAERKPLVVLVVRSS
jgi:hypothetical protein